MDAKKQAVTVDAYRDSRPQYERFTQRIEGLIRELLSANGIQYHLIESRTKEVSSFKDKITRASKTYREPLKEITDLSGLRVITYYQDDADAIGRLLNQEFSVDKANSVQHSASGAEFGYKSAHYVVALTNDRAKLVEWASFHGMYAEVQVRTVLQHAWAAISHKLQYKREEDVPLKLQRKLFRLSALFELADDEFISLRDTSVVVSTEIRKQLDEGNLQLPLDSVSVSSLLASSTAVTEIAAAAAEAGFDFEPVEDDLYDAEDSAGVSDLIQLAKLAGLQTAGQLEDSLEEFAKKDTAFFTKLIESSSAQGSRGWSVTTPFVCQLALICRFANRFRVGHLMRLRYERPVASRVIDVARAFQGRNG